MFSLRGKARAWIDDLASGRVHPFAEIIAREGKVERHISLLTSNPDAGATPTLPALRPRGRRLVRRLEETNYLANVALGSIDQEHLALGHDPADV